MKGFVFHPERCDLCGKCEAACIGYLQEKNKTGCFVSAIHIAVGGEGPSLSVCRQCEDAPCVNACIAGAIQKDETAHMVRHHADRCVGCMMCGMVCPWGAPLPLYRQKKILKCSLTCGGNRPPCIAACDRNALFLEEIQHKLKSRRKLRSKMIPVEKMRP